MAACGAVGRARRDAVWCGLLSTFFEYAFRRDQERAVTEHFRQTIREEAPALRDAVIEAFRFDRQDVARIATPELLDDLARTSLGLRFGDPAFGREVYADIRHQAMAAVIPLRNLPRQSVVQIGFGGGWMMRAHTACWFKPNG